jgi:hypothetical protein
MYTFTLTPVTESGEELWRGSVNGYTFTTLYDCPVYASLCLTHICKWLNHLHGGTSDDASTD